jgi:hypothetical protein
MRNIKIRTASILTLAALSLITVVQADNVAVSSPDQMAYQAAIQSFGVDPAVAKRAAALAVEEVDKSRQDRQPIREDAFASLPADFLDQSPY